MKSLYLIAAFFLSVAGTAHAAVYKSIDANGLVTYSNQPVAGSARVDLPPVNVINTSARARNLNRATSPSTPTGGSITSTGGTTVTQNPAGTAIFTTPLDSSVILSSGLQEQLDAEQAQLTLARAALKEAKDNRSAVTRVGTVTGSDARRLTGGTGDSNIDRLEAAIKVHEQNIVVLRNELTATNTASTQQTNNNAGNNPAGGNSVPSLVTGVPTLIQNNPSLTGGNVPSLTSSAPSLTRGNVPTLTTSAPALTSGNVPSLTTAAPSLTSQGTAAATTGNASSSSGVAPAASVGRIQRAR